MRQEPLKQISERDDVPSRHMVLFVSSLLAGKNSKADGVIEVSDGWYAMQAVLDEGLWELVESGQLKVGTKFACVGAKLFGDDHQQPMDILEGYGHVRLSLGYNGVRPVPWDTRLGLQRSLAWVTPLSHVKGFGGFIPVLRAVILRRYPMCYVQNSPDGKNKHVVPEKVFQRNRFDAEARFCRVLLGDYRRTEQIASNKIIVKEALLTCWNIDDCQAEALKAGHVIELFGLKPSAKKDPTNRLTLCTLKSTFIRKASAPSDASIYSNETSPELSVNHDYDLTAITVIHTQKDTIAKCTRLFGVHPAVQLFCLMVPERLSPLLPIIKPGSLSIKDALFIYWDPKFKFPVFLLTDRSDLIASCASPSALIVDISPIKSFLFGNVLN